MDLDGRASFVNERSNVLRVAYLHERLIGFFSRPIRTAPEIEKNSRLFIALARCDSYFFMVNQANDGDDDD